MQRKPKLLAASLLAAVAMAVPSAWADTINDTVGDLNDGTVGDDFSGATHLDIVSVEVTNSFTDLIFKINLVGNPVAVDWGKYCIGISTNGSTGDTTANGNGWGRCISMGQGMDYWIGTWVDGGNGAQLWAYDGLLWNQSGAATVSKDSSSVTIRTPFADISKSVGDTVEFEVYTTGGGGGDPAIDALSNPNVTVTEWAGCYSSTLSSFYTIQAIPATTNRVTFLCDMGVPIWEFDTATANGFDTNSDMLYVRGPFTTPPWSSVAGYEMIQVGPTLFSNTVDVVAPIGDSVEFKFFGDPFPDYESPALLGGGNRSVTITGPDVTAPQVCFSDRCLTDPPVSTVNLEVDMGFQQAFGEFDPNAPNGVALPGNFNGWNTTALLLTPGLPPDTNIYSGTVTYNYYPMTTENIGFFKFKIDGSTTARDGGWERPISTGGGNRAFALGSTNQTLTFLFNDEDGVFDIDQIQKGADSVTLTFGAYAEAIYEVQSRATSTSTWSTLGSVTNNMKNFGNVSFVRTGLGGADEQYYRAVFTGFNKPPLP